MIESELHTIASVNAICRLMSAAPILLRRNVRRMSMNSMAPSVGLKLQCRLHAAGPPGRIKPRAHRRHDCNTGRDEYHSRIQGIKEPREGVIATRQRPLTGLPDRRQSETKSATQDAEEHRLGPV